MAERDREVPMECVVQPMDPFTLNQFLSSKNLKKPNIEAFLKAVRKYHKAVKLASDTLDKEFKALIPPSIPNKKPAKVKNKPVVKKPLKKK